jgi:dienelactone hydrolase
MRKRLVGLAMLAATAAIAGCATPSATPKTTASSPDFSVRGPSSVSVTSLDLGSAGSVLGERSATAFYPIDPPAKSGDPKAEVCRRGFSYSQSETLPASLRSVLPASYDTVQAIPGVEVGCDGGGLAASRHPHPILLFSHGYGGERLYYSNLLAGIASWGYVVVSADYLERGLASQALPDAPKSSATLDRSVMLTSLRAVTSASKEPSSPLFRSVDAAKVAAAGHSMGGQTAFDALSAPGVATAIGWAPVGPASKPADKPTMIIAATGDSAITTAKVTRTYRSFAAPKSLIQVSGLGHNTYTDICVGIRGGGGLINFAVANHFVSKRLAKLGINGCESSDAPPKRFWPVVQYYTVFQLRNVFAGTASSVPVPEPASSFSTLKVAVTQEQ